MAPLHCFRQLLLADPTAALVAPPLFVLECGMDPDGTIKEALKLIDPEGMLIPGTRQYDRISEMIYIWLRRHSRDEVLEMARYSAKHLKVWVEGAVR